MNTIRWGCGWQAMKICPWWLDFHRVTPSAALWQWEQVGVSGRSHARDLIADALPQAAAMRAVLEEGNTNLSRLNDSDMLEHVAGLLADGQLLLLRRVLTAEGAKVPTQIGPAPTKVAPGKGIDGTVKSVIKPVFSMPQRVVPVDVPVVQPGDFDRIEQARQAAALLAAALAGVPLVQLCDPPVRA